jgi:heme-degrading monooxygenase HmoA
MNQPIQLTEVPVTEPVTMINAFTFPQGEEERFLQRWTERARIMAGLPEFINSTMYRSLVDDADFRFVNVAQWGSGQALVQARTNPLWRESVRATLDDPGLHITARPAIYEVAVDLRPETRRQP